MIVNASLAQPSRSAAWLLVGDRLSLLCEIAVVVTALRLRAIPNETDPAVICMILDHLSAPRGKAAG